MAMNPPPEQPPSEAPTREELDLQLAVQELRDHTDARWVEIADSMLVDVISKARPSHPVRGAVGPAEFHVSEQVIRAYVLDAIDSVPDVDVDDIRVQADKDRYTGITVVITARHGLPLVPAADAIRSATRTCLVDLLGEQVPPITVSRMHVHVENVTLEDPRLS